MASILSTADNRDEITLDEFGQYWHSPEFCLLSTMLGKENSEQDARGD
jgi:hypothetical protein